MDIYMYDGKALQYDGKYIAPKATGETWVLNKLLTLTDGNSANFEIKFVSCDTNFISINILLMKFIVNCSYKADSYAQSVYVGSWLDEAYRTVTFLEPPTGDLLTWLQANGVKQ